MTHYGNENVNRKMRNLPRIKKKPLNLKSILIKYCIIYTSHILQPTTFISALITDWILFGVQVTTYFIIAAYQ